MEDILNPDVMRKRLTAAGLYLVAYEVLISAIIDPIREFFSREWSKARGWHFSETYRQEVLTLDPKGKQDALRSSMKWLENEGIINVDDINKFTQITTVRNQFAHDLGNIVSTGELSDFDHYFSEIVELVIKIGQWWFSVEMEVERAVARNLESNCDGYDIDSKEVVPISAVFLQILEQVALGDDQAAWEFYQAYKSNQKNPNR